MNDYKWIQFLQANSTGKTKIFLCFNKETEGRIGIVKWYGSFRKYSFFPDNNMVFETQCLKDIASFLDKLMLERKLEKQSVKQ